MAGGPHATRVPEGPFAKITAVGTLVLIAGTAVLIVLAYLGVAVAVRWPPFGAPATGSSAWGVLWSGPVGITGNGLNFDDQPRPSSQSADIYYNGSLFSSSSAILAVWPQAQPPTAGQCLAWVTTHPGTGVSTLTAGMQICLQTGQGRPVLLHVHSAASQELDADATVWQRGSSAAIQSSAGTAAGRWGVLWTGPVAITGNGLNFDDQPRPSSQSADIYYNGSLFSSSSAILAVWPQAQPPTAGECLAWVTTHPGTSVSTLTAGMQICLQTGQGRPVLLHVHSLASQELDADATVWQQQ